MKDFYLTLGCVIWLNQGDCIIFQHDNFLFGFCEREDISTGWLLTFFYKTKEEVDEIYSLIKDKAVSQPSYNTKYQIYQFFAKDPEGRNLEFQVFLHKIPFNWDLYQ